MTRQDIEAVLAAIRLPSGQALTTSGRLGEIIITDGRVMTSIAIDPTEASAMESVRKAAEGAILSVKGVKQVLVSLTADKPSSKATPSTQPHVTPGRPQQAPSPKVTGIPVSNM